MKPDCLARGLALLMTALGVFASGVASASAPAPSPVSKWAEVVKTTGAKVE